MEFNLLKIFILAVVVLYAVSPIDFCPGNSIDDLIVALFGYAVSKRLPAK